MNASYHSWLLLPSVALTLAALFATPRARAADAPSRPAEVRVYFGTYTGAESKGIYVGQFDSATGAITSVKLAAETKNPSFLAIHPNRQYLYAVGELGSFAGKRGGAVSAFRIDPQTGMLTPLNQQSSGGAGPCHVTVDRAGNNVLVANYGAGSAAVLPILPDGRLKEATTVIQHEGSSVDRRRQQGPHAHSVNVDAGNRFAMVADLGLDKVMIYRLDSQAGTLTPNATPWAKVQPGAGPRHFAFHPCGRFAYVINEMASTVTAFRFDAEAGRLEEIQTLGTLPAGFTGESTTAEVQVHPSGKFLYGSNRGHDSIAVFTIAADTGKLTAVQHEPSQGKMPRNFGIDPTGTFLLAAHQKTDNVVVFRIDPSTGKLTPTGHQIKVGSPVCVKFLVVR
jgi:6-phosphogluconolactonase